MKKLNIFILSVCTLCACNVINNPDNKQKGDPIILKTALQAKVSQDNEFAFDLLKNTVTNSDETNVVLSPLSVSIALGMAWNGAAGETKSQIETALKMNNLSTYDINEYYKVMQTSLPNVDPKTQLAIANSLWYKTGFSIKQDFLNLNSTNFGAYIKELDFDQSWAKDTINNWCSNKTNGLIPSIVDQISQDVRLYLINAVYFKGIWEKQFDKDRTYESRFTDESGNSSEINMMSMTDTFPYWEDNRAQYIELPYGNESFGMTIILPEWGTNITELLDSITSEKWDSAISDMTSREVRINLPRFKSECKFTLNQPLKDMGMQLPFTDYADFSGISDDQLTISQILHKTYVAVDEDGTEAAAVTAIEFETTSLPDYPTVNVNRPFIFVIRERNTGIILFIGKMGSVTKY
ncbi:MAG: serpin family protein [Paludibacter sp.]|nr:serpin family protein [Paludibacter sp.]